MVTGLIEKAKDRRVKREQTKNQPTNTNTQTLQSLLSNLSTSKIPNQEVKPVESLVTPLNLLLNPTTDSTTSIKSDNVNNNNNTKSIDIIQMLNKAQAQFTQTHLEPASHSTPGGVNLLLNQNSPLSTTSSNDPKPIAQWPHNLFLNSNQFIKPEPIRQTNIVSPALSNTSSTTTKSNPILQLLMPNESQNQTLNQSQDLAASLDLKRKLNIQSSSSNAVLTSPIIGASPSMILTPSNENNILLNNLLTGPKPSVLLNSRPMTVKDFEDNLLNQSTVGDKLIGISEPGLKPGMFYLTNESSSNNTTSSEYNSINKPNLTFSKQKNSLNLSSSSSSSSDSDSSDSDTDSEPSSPNGLPLLLTPAAFESSSASSTTSSSYQNDKLNEVVGAGIVENGSSANTNVNAASTLNAFFNPQISGFLFPNQFNFSESNNTMQSVNSNVNMNENNLEQISPLTKNQLQHVLIHLLNVCILLLDF